MEQSRRIGPMAGRKVLITGGTSGIGRATTLGLAAMGAHLAITGRDRERTEDAAREIRAAGGGQVDVFVADLSSQSQVRRLAREVLQRLPRIDVLVNNAGGYWDTRHVTADGLEHTFALNHLAPSPPLLPYDTPPPSALPPSPSELPPPPPLLPPPFMRPFMKAPARGAATSIHVASAPGLEQVTGRYFAGSKPRKSSRRSHDQAVAARLWQVSTTWPDRGQPPVTGWLSRARALPAGPRGGRGRSARLLFHRTGGSGVLDRGDFELQDDLLADQDATGLQRGVPGDAVVLAVDGD